MPIHKNYKSGYIKQSDMKIIFINNRPYYLCEKIKRSGCATFRNSVYKYECDLCMYSVDKNGDLISNRDSGNGEYTPHSLWCPYAECPYKEEFENKDTKRRQLTGGGFSDYLNKLLDDFEKGV